MDIEEIHLHHYITNLQSELTLELYLLCLIFGGISDNKQCLYMFPSLEQYSDLNRLVLLILLTNNMLTKHTKNMGSSMIKSGVMED